MADLLFDNQSAPSTPSAGQNILYPDTTSKLWWTKDENGLYHGNTYRTAVAAQGAGFATDTYVTNSGLLIPGFGMQAGMVFRWTISASKTAASTATPVYSIRIGTNQSTADTARLQLTGPAQTAAADVGLLSIVMSVRSVSASGTFAGTANWSHNGAAAGFCNNDSGSVEGTSAAFDNSALGASYVGLSINGGTSSSWTITQVIGEMFC